MSQKRIAPLILTTRAMKKIDTLMETYTTNLVHEITQGMTGASTATLIRWPWAEGVPSTDTNLEVLQVSDQHFQSPVDWRM